MNRRIIVLLLAVLLGLAWSPLAAWAGAPEKPNIIYILLDDAGYGDLSSYGQTKFSTPHMDRLAAEGMKFTDHYSGSTVCAPTRCSLMMGQHTGNCFIRGNQEVRPEGQWPIPADAKTIPRLLKQAGYVSGMFGKWGLGPPGSHADPTLHFDESYGYNCQRHAHTYYPDYLWHNDQKVPLDGKTYSQDLIAARALEFVKRHQDGPFFCYLSVAVPHAAMQVPEDSHQPFREKFPQFEDKIGRYAGTEVRNPIAAFAGMMTRLDQQVGQLLDTLEELGIQDNTLVLLTSDNGPHLEGGHDPRFFQSGGPLRGFKRDLYEGGIRVPLLARWPGKIPAGTTSDLISAHWDMLPTFCELAGIDPPGDIDGVSVVPTLRGNPDQQQQHEFLYWEFPAQGGKQAVRAGHWKAVRLNLQKDPDAPVELYDLNEDIAEQNDVAEQHPQIVAKMLAIMHREHTPSERFPLYSR